MSKEKQIEEMDCKKCLHYEMCLENFRRAKEDGLWELTDEEEYFAHADECDFYAAGYRKQSDNVIELPCNIGDSCYPLPRCKKPIVERKVSRITISKRNIIIGYYENDGQYRPPLRTRTLGEDVFLTKEEAEAKMKGGAE